MDPWINFLKAICLDAWIDPCIYFLVWIDPCIYFLVWIDPCIYCLVWIDPCIYFLVWIETWIFVSDPTIIGSSVLVPSDLWIYFVDSHVYFQISLATPKRKSDFTTCVTIKKTYDHKHTYTHTHPD